ncbi:MAG: hypothetical protein CMJ59_07460 [Planctomycetaceae bacterium]|nr:hypothetical protein [Planctomycetaceae bacterium]
MTPFKEDAWDPKVICKWLIQIGLVVSFIYLSYRTYLIYQDPPNDVDQKKVAFENAEILVYISVNGFVLFLLFTSRVLEYYRERKNRHKINAPPIA